MRSIWDFIVEVFCKLFDVYHRPGPGVWRGSLFIPHKLYGTNTTPVWPGNRGVDSLMAAAYDAASGQPWQAAKRTNWFQWAHSYGADTWYLIAEPMFKNPAVLKYFSSEKEGFIQEARKHGIKRGVVGLFNDGPLMSPDFRKAHIKAICEAYAWANVHEIMFLTCLESEKNMKPAEVKQIHGWLKQYGGGKRIAVGSPRADFLKACSGNGIELWSECDEHPFDLNTIVRADVYLAKLRDLQKYGRGWAGEHCAGGSGEVDKYITAEADKIGLDHGSGYYK
jgi:hypothetical protein